MSRPLVIDTDPGVDDALAILLALASPELDVRAVTTIFGNASTELTTRNALAVLDRADRPDIPVAAGERNPIAADYLGPVLHVHASTVSGAAVSIRPVVRPERPRPPT